MFATEVAKINGPQSDSLGGITPAMFIDQCGHHADYDLYVTPEQYNDVSLVAPCHQAGLSCVATTTTASGAPFKGRRLGWCLGMCLGRSGAVLVLNLTMGPHL